MQWNWHQGERSGQCKRENLRCMRLKRRHKRVRKVEKVKVSNNKRMEMLTAALGICWRGVRLLYESLCWVKKMPSPAYCSLGPAWGLQGTPMLKGRGGSHTVFTLLLHCEGATEVFCSTSPLTPNHPVFFCQVIHLIDLKKESASSSLNTKFCELAKKCMFAHHTEHSCSANSFTTKALPYV